MVLSLYILIVIALPLALGAVTVYRGLIRSRHCPGCGARTVRLRSPVLDLAGRLLRRSNFQKRWCMACGWTGPIRLRRDGRVSRRGSTPRPAGPGPARSSVEVRHLEIDGQPWRVLVQCWTEEDRWLGRLLFVASTGRIWTEDVTLEGESLQTILSRAMTLPEQTIAGRVRRVIR